MATNKPTPRLCSVENCERKSSAKGMCDSHYRRWRETGTPHKKCRTCDTEMPGYSGRGNFYCSEECRICKIDGCDKPMHSKQMCHMHVQRVRVGGSPYRKCESCGKEMPEDFGLAKYCSANCRPRCKVDGCLEPYRSNDGYCARHKRLARKHGKPEGGYEWTPKSDKYKCLSCERSFKPNGRSRKFCSARCQQLHVTYQGDIPSLDFDCVLCGKHFKRNRWDGLAQRVDKRLCDHCRMMKSKRHGTSPGELAKRHGTDCGICGEPVDMDLKYPERMRGSVDHIIPVSKGGALSDPENLQLAHLQCNVTKQARLDYKPA